MGEEQVLLRTSERVAFRRCRQRWYWNYVEGLQPKSESPALAFGNLIHQALEAYYIPGRKRGIHPAKAFAKFFDAQPVSGRQWDEDGNAIESRDLGIAMLEGYVEHHGKDSRYKIIAPEMRGAVDVHNSQGKYLCTLVFTFDGVAYDNQTGKIVLLEHKTAKSIKLVAVNSQYGDQALTYVWAANLWLHYKGILPKDQHVSTVVFNFLRKAMPDDRPRNAQGLYLNKPKKEALLSRCYELGYSGSDINKGTIEYLSNVLISARQDPLLLGEPSEKQPPPLFLRQELVFGQGEFANLERRIRNEAWEMQQARKRKLPIYKNPTDDCSWDCSFRDICELHEMGADYETVLQFDFHKWNPYATYELRKEHK